MLTKSAKLSPLTSPHLHLVVLRSFLSLTLGCVDFHLTASSLDGSFFKQLILNSLQLSTVRRDVLIKTCVSTHYCVA